MNTKLIRTLILGSSLILSACGDGTFPECKFKRFEFVQMEVNDFKGQVNQTHRNHNSCVYRVRTSDSSGLIQEDLYYERELRKIK